MRGTDLVLRIFYLAFAASCGIIEEMRKKGAADVLHLLIGTDWVAIREELLNRIARDVAMERKNRILMVPELISHDTERRLCTAAGDTASRFAEVLTFTRLGRRVADYVGGGCGECLDSGGRLVAMAAAARQLSGQLKVYASVMTKPEFLTEMIEAVDEFKRCCITSRDLQAAAAKAEGTLAQKLQELALLVDAYDGICAQGKRDPRDREMQLLEQLRDSDFAENHVFYIDGFPDFTRQHLAVLEHLIQSSEDVTIGINCDGMGSRALAFEKASDTASQLYRMANRAGIPVSVENVAGRQGELAKIFTALFQGSSPQVGDQLNVRRCESVYDEVTAAAEQVLDLVRGGCRYRDIAIACADPGAYQNALEMVFHRCGIPTYRSGKEDILQKTVIVTVISALEAALEGMEQHAVLRYLKSILSPLDNDTCDRVENYALLWGIRGNGWAKPWTKHPDGLSALWTDEAKEKLRNLENARLATMTPLLRLRQGFDEARNLSGQVVALYHFLEEIHLAENMGKLAQNLEDADDYRDAQILNQLWEILLSALEQLHDVLGQTVWETETFVRLLILLLSQYDVGTIPPVLDAVTVGMISDMRCQQEKHLIVLGAGEGSLPGYGGSKGLLTDQERTALRDMGVPLTGGAIEGIQAEFAEIYGVFCGAMESITVSCASSQPSYVYKRLMKMAGGEQVVTPRLGAALRDRSEAAALLVKYQQAEDALFLDIETQTLDVRRKAEFELGTISRENVQALYGQRLHLSASQVDRQAECRMSYFLKYGLQAKERKEASVDPAEFGTYVHYVLELTARKVMELGGFQAVSLQDTLDIAMGYSDDYAREHFADVDSTRISYLFRRNRRELEMVVTELWHELKAARFRPEDFEMKFGDGGRMPAIEIGSGTMPASLRGFVDRVDIWNEDGRNYFRVVDYKTGKKDFDYCDVFNGVGLQMLLYLFALEQGSFGTAAGVQYFPARAPLMSVDGKLTDEDAALQRAKEWKRRGLLLHDEAVLDAMDPDDWNRLCAARKKDGTVTGDLADRAQLKMLRKYVFWILREMVDDIASGNVTANPYSRGTSHDACAFCPYGSICHKDHVEGRRNYKAMTAQRFWDDVRKEVEGHG